MRNWIIGIVIAIVTAGLGVGAAYGVKTLVQQNAPAVRSTIQDVRGNNQLRGAVRQPGQGRNQTALTLDQAVAQAQAYAKQNGSDWKLDKVLEFQNAFDVIFVENGTGRGAAQLILPKAGRGMQMVPAMRWNLKYGPAAESKASGTGAADNSVSLSDARTAAQTYLTNASTGATLNEGGYSFYGYYLFEYSVGGKTAGVVIVNGLTSQATELKQLGAFLSEKEISQ
jgi:hypothetical protein